MTESFRDLVAWQRAIRLITEVYRATKEFPKDELYGLTSQLRRSSVSIASNIAEGKGRLSKREYVQFLSRARGSLCEAETQLEVARELGYLTEDAHRILQELASLTARPLNGLITSVQRQFEEPES